MPLLTEPKKEAANKGEMWFSEFKSQHQSRKKRMISCFSNQDCEYALFIFARYLEQCLAKLKCLRGVGNKKEKTTGEKEVEEGST